MRALLGFLVVLAVVGCGSQPDSKSTETGTAPAAPKGAPNKPSTTLARPSGGGSGGSIAPIGPNVGGMTPVAGSDSVEGGGMGGVGNAAKSQARKAADQGQGQPQAPGDGQE